MYMAFRVVLAVALLLAAPSAARAVTLDDIVALSKAGVAADILVAVIDADRTIFTLTPDEILVLKDAGVPNAVIVKMLRTQREFVDAAPPPLIVGNAPAPAVTVVVPTYFAWPFFVAPGIPVVTPVAGSLQPRGFGRFINDGWIDGRGFGRFINTP
jgi:hypothetical protein